MGSCWERTYETQEVSNDGRKETLVNRTARNSLDIVFESR